MLKASLRPGVLVAGLIVVLIFDLVVGGVLGATLFANRGATPSASAQHTTTVPPLTTVTIPQSQEMFDPFILVVQPNTIVTWQNNDTIAHTITTTSDQTPFLNLQALINPADIGINRIAGTDDIPGGDTITVIFSKPGLYYYYCPNHAHIDAATHRAEAFKLASEYPIPMEGFILVTGTSPPV